MYKELVELSYKTENLEPILISETPENLNCFIEANSVGAYPPRFDFEIFQHNLKKNNLYVLKWGADGVAKIAVRNRELRIIDMFLDTTFQKQSILKGMLNTIKKEVIKEYTTVKYITLSSLPSGIVAWHKMGFEFYNILDKVKVRNALSEHLGYRVDLKSITKDELENRGCYDILQNKDCSSIAMYMEIGR